MYVLHIYTFSALFVPHLKNPRYHKNRVCSTKSANDSYYFSPASKNQASKFLVASAFRKNCWSHFCSGGSFPVCTSKFRQNRILADIFISVGTPAWSISQQSSWEDWSSKQKNDTQKWRRNRDGMSQLGSGGKNMEIWCKGTNDAEIIIPNSNIWITC